ncbi:hydrolase, alpha/beta domain protein [Campylobacter rectus RM3267]|uniref:Alpha/beta hydrolase family protein n=2 Tax=Campylobacter rectus TaxID=203 RepID=A0A6G5QMN3_CAMRE|nr:alpha/beta hydrolase [Campylobacter rectus]EEF13648.1 hydrolase, alpha/beta domain protein [Campylobacter rectus RM3267]QCD46842.1 alpha/beta hydrolase family protein [Campylobacter rectus]UEB47544.1 alpha/beta hydrolase [Campylobacter rectus]
MAVKEVKYGGKIYRISYETVNPAHKDVALFLHGWGANKEIMKKAFGTYFKDFRHVYVDMPGFGASSMYGALATKDYAKIIKSFLDELGASPKIIFGHSFGGKVATLLNPEYLALLSSAGIVAKKPLWVRFKIALFKFLKLFGLGFLYKFFATKDVKGMSKTMYETLKNVVDEDFSSKFADFGGRAFIFWGEEDKATPLKSGERVSRLIKNSEFHALKGDHFFFLLHARYIDGVVNAGLNLTDLDDESGIESVKILSPKNYENLSEEAWGADKNGDLKNHTEQNLTESISAVSEQEVAISTKTVSQSSLFDEQSQDGGLADKNPQLDGAKDGDLADKFDGVYQNSQANLDENEVGDESGRVPSKNIFKEKAQNSLFDEQGSERSEPVAGVDDENLQILPSETSNNAEQKQILSKIGGQTKVLSRENLDSKQNFDKKKERESRSKNLQKTGATDI